MLPRPTDTPSGEERWDTKLVTKARPAIEEISCFADKASEYPYVDFVWKNWREWSAIIWLFSVLMNRTGQRWMAAFAEIRQTDGSPRFQTRPTHWPISFQIPDKVTNGVMGHMSVSTAWIWRIRPGLPEQRNVAMLKSKVMVRLFKLEMVIWLWVTSVPERSAQLAPVIVLHHLRVYHSTKN